MSSTPPDPGNVSVRPGPFFSYYGAKWRMSGLLPPPRYGQIFEAFAGSACYATRWPDEGPVTLADANPVVRATWEYLIRTPSAEIRALPLLAPGEDVRARIPVQEAAWLVGWWLNSGAVRPHRTIGKRGREKLGGRGWTALTREWVARHAERIRHWRVVSDFRDLPRELGTWIVDPPYQGPAGRLYPFGADKLDYGEVREWTRRRNGLIVVHEGPDATWFPEASVVGYTNASGGKNGRTRSAERLAVFDTLTREDLVVPVALAMGGIR